MSLSSISDKTDKQKKIPNLKPFVKGVSLVAGGTFLGISMVASSVVAGALVGLAISFRNLPDVRVLNNYVPKQTNYIYDVHGKLLTSFHQEENRQIVELDEISPELKLAVLAIEDSHFYQHEGINPNSIARAAIVNWREGEVVEGASTLTMQLVKNLFLTHQRTFDRKLAEVVLAVRVEQIYSKEEILEKYLNNIYWGHNSYGVETAAQSYFRKSASELNLAEATMMAGLIQSPEKYSPYHNYNATKARQAVVLRRMRELGWISVAEEEEAKKTPLLIATNTKAISWQKSKLPQVTDVVIRELRKQFSPEQIRQGGLYIQTSIDYDFQRQAEEIVNEAHDNLVDNGLEEAQIVLVAIDPRTHFVKALVGGVNYKESNFHRAIQSKRQPGSAFKPFVYYTAFASGQYQPSDIIEDEEVTYWEVDGPYKPQNYDEEFLGEISLEESLFWSRNIPAVKLGQAVGLDSVIDNAHLIGIESPLYPITSLPLGSMEVTPLEMASAYATFASNGWYSEPTMIIRVTDSQGNLLLDNSPQPRQLLDPWATATLTNVLQGVIEKGTGQAAQIGRPAAGKTGTTSSERDVWFVGYVPQLATVVWVGNDDYESLGEGITGGEYAAPIWRDFMKFALENEAILEFPSPENFTPPTP